MVFIISQMSWDAAFASSDPKKPRIHSNFKILWESLLEIKELDNFFAENDNPKNKLFEILQALISFEYNKKKSELEAKETDSEGFTKAELQRWTRTELRQHRIDARIYDSPSPPYRRYDYDEELPW
jgi:hypothetical protein